MKFFYSFTTHYYSSNSWNRRGPTPTRAQPSVRVRPTEENNVTRFPTKYEIDAIKSGRK